MPTRVEWEKVHADLMAQLRLPCKLEFSTRVKVGQHVWRSEPECWGELNVCYITVNPEVDFRNPEHLILHEGAHHRAIEPYLDAELDGQCHHTGWNGHCEHWAQILCDMYKETGYKLPYSTSFETFAEIAGIKHKLFE
jgi:hypothetical protein